MANVLNQSTQSIIRPVHRPVLGSVAQSIVLPPNLEAPGGGEGGFNPNDYPSLVADFDPSILSSLLDGSDVPINGDQDDVVKSVLDSADNPTAYRWWNSGTTKRYFPNVDGHPCVNIALTSSLVTVDGEGAEIALHTSSQMTLFTVSRFVTSTSNFSYVYQSSLSANGFHGLMFDTRTQKRMTFSIGDGGAQIGNDLPARDQTLAIRVISMLADHHGGPVKSYRDNANEAITASHATQEYFVPGSASITDAGPSTYVFRILVYDALLSQAQHDEIAAALVARYLP